MEATGYARWFERLLAELPFELWIGDPGEIRAKRVRKQKTDRQDAEHLIAIAGGESFSADLGTQSGESRSAATTLAPTSAGANADAIEEPVPGHRPERRSTTQERVVEQAGAGPVRVARVGSVECAARARSAGTSGSLESRIDELSTAIEQTTEQRPEVQRLMTHPGVGPITALCADPRSAGSVSLWQASRQLSGADPQRRIQQRSPTFRSYQQATHCCGFC